MIDKTQREVQAVMERQAAEREASKPAPKNAGNRARAQRAAASKATKPSTEKAEPADVRAFLDGLGLTNKQAAEALGKSVALIATVRSDKGDRWSRERWEAAKKIFQVYAKKHAAKTATEGVKE